MLGAELSLLSSNKTLKRVIEEYTGKEYAGLRAADLPDLLLIAGVSGRHVQIEFKRPDLDITREHEAQATTYRDELIRRFPGLDIVLIGRAWASHSDRTFVPYGLGVTSYDAVIARARAETTWLLTQLTSENHPVPGAGRVPLSLRVG